MKLKIRFKVTSDPLNNKWGHYFPSNIQWGWFEIIWILGNWNVLSEVWRRTSINKYPTRKSESLGSKNERNLDEIQNDASMSLCDKGLIEVLSWLLLKTSKDPWRKQRWMSWENNNFISNRHLNPYMIWKTEAEVFDRFINQGKGYCQKSIFIAWSLMIPHVTLNKISFLWCYINPKVYCSTIIIRFVFKLMWGLHSLWVKMGGVQNKLRKLSKNGEHSFQITSQKNIQTKNIKE